MIFYIFEMYIFLYIFFNYVKVGLFKILKEWGRFKTKDKGSSTNQIRK